MIKRFSIKTNICAFIILAVLFAALTGCSSGDKVAYNMEPDNAKKVVGSKYRLGEIVSVDTNMVDSLETLFKYAQVAVIGEVISDGILKNDEASEQDSGNSIIKRPVEKHTPYQVRVEEVVCGSLEPKEITLSQIGEPGDDRGETKVKKGDRMLFVLHEISQEDGIYDSAVLEGGMFIIDKNNKVMSLSDNIAVAKYDGLDLDVLKKDLKEAFEQAKG